jgi:acyl-CoA thioesterase-2
MLKRGRAFQTARVEITQGAEHVASATVTFHAGEAGRDRQAAMPAVPPPEACPLFQPRDFGRASPAYGPVEARLAAHDESGPALQIWLRFVADLSSDAVSRAAAFVWLSDLTMTRTVDLPHRGAAANTRQAASLDHAVWLHRPVDPTSWLLADQRSDSFSGARGTARARYHDRRGTLRASAMQECLIRGTTGGSSSGHHAIL